MQCCWHGVSICNTDTRTTLAHRRTQLMLKQRSRLGSTASSLRHALFGTAAVTVCTAQCQFLRPQDDVFRRCSACEDCQRTCWGTLPAIECVNTLQNQRWAAHPHRLACCDMCEPANASFRLGPSQTPYYSTPERHQGNNHGDGGHCAVSCHVVRHVRLAFELL